MREVEYHEPILDSGVELPPRRVVRARLSYVVWEICLGISTLEIEGMEGMGEIRFDTGREKAEDGMRTRARDRMSGTEKIFMNFGVGRCVLGRKGLSGRSPIVSQAKNRTPVPTLLVKL